MATKRMIVVLVWVCALALGSLSVAPKILAGFTPTPPPPTGIPSPPPPTGTPPVAPTQVPPPGGDKECMRRVVIMLTGCVPPGAVVSLWNGVDPANHSSPTGRMRFEAPFRGQPIDSGFLPGVLYHVWLWAPDHPFEFLGEFQTSQCGNTPLTFDYPCAPTPTATLAPTVTPIPVATPTLATTPEVVMPSTGDPAGREGFYALLGVVAFVGAVLGYQRLLKRKGKTSPQ